MSDNKKSNEHEVASRPLIPSLGRTLGKFLLYAGVALLGVLMLFRPAVPNYVRYIAISLIVIGVLLWLLSTTSRLQTLEWLKSGAIALTLALLIRWPIAEPYRIPSGSMEPTLKGDPRMFRGDRVFVNKWSYGVRYPFMNKRIWYGQEPQRWELVVFKSVEPDAEHTTLVKRIVGMPGERVHIQEGKVFVNGVPLELPPSMPPDTYYTAPNFGFSQMRYGVIEDDEYSLIPPNHYFLLGDNSGNSRDGRYFGWVPNEHLVGRVFCIWWPPSSWSDFTGFTKSFWWRGIVLFLGLWIVARLFVGRSWAIRTEEGKIDHLYVHFLALGLRLPFTRYWLFQWGNPGRGDVVLYWPQGAQEPQLGRIAGLPNEKVTLSGGKLQINGNTLTEPLPLTSQNYPLSHPEARYGKPGGKEVQVPEGSYFILTDITIGGDAPDSRIVGWIPRKRIVGKVLATWWPLAHRSRIT